MRVIAFFDMLLERRASPRALVQATAGLAQCVVGWRRSNGSVIRLAPSAAQSRQLNDPPSPSVELEIADHGVVWLERPGSPEPFDELVLERLALVAGALGPHSRPRQDGGTEFDATQVLVDSTRSEDARAAAARTLGLRSDRPVVLVAVRHCMKRDPSVWARDLEQCWPADRVHVTSQDGLAAVVVQQVVTHDTIEHSLSEHLLTTMSAESRSDPELRAGTSTPRLATQAHLCWEEARTALRFAGATRMDVVASYERLGSLTLLARVPTSVLREDAGVRAIAQLRARPTGADQLGVLQAFCRTGSLRQASTELHLHHSTIASHLARISAKVHWDLTTPLGRLSALTSLYADHLCNS
ncbi:helix-turn-helix domain-containing protein [Pseudonocardia ailaonensis]